MNKILSFAKEFVCWECKGHCRLRAELQPHSCLFDKEIKAKWSEIDGVCVKDAK